MQVDKGEVIATASQRAWEGADWVDRELPLIIEAWHCGPFTTPSRRVACEWRPAERLSEEVQRRAAVAEGNLQHPREA